MISASQINIIPFTEEIFQNVKLQSNFYSVDLKKSNLTFNGGASSTVLDIYDSIKDITINNDSLLMLSKHKKINKIYKNTTKTLLNKKNLINYTLLKNLYQQEEYKTTGFYRQNGVAVSEDLIHIKNEEKYKYINSIDNLLTFQDNADIKNSLFKLIFEEDYVYIVNTKKNALTQADARFIFTPHDNLITQRFNYILNDISIILFEYNTQFNKVIIFNNIKNSIYIENISNTLPNNSILYIDNNKNIYNKNLLVDSFIAKYKTDALSSVNNLDLDENTKLINYEQEYLINIPYKNKNPLVYINSLKNYQTPNYEYSLNNNQPKRREYTNIFTGGNREKGHKNIYLNYTSNTLEKIFKTNTETVFHYPATVPTSGVYLSAAGLIEDGAIAGSNPFTADRVGYNRSDYRDLNLPSPSSVISDNTWQYAWLSAGDNGESIWMDRHYFGAYYETVSQGYLLYKVRDPLIADVPSTMLFLPNRIYSYYHQGLDNIKKYTDNFNSVDRSKSTKILEITAWNNIIVEDSSIFKNNGTICLNNSSFEVDYLQLNGSNYVVFPASDSLSESRQLTVGFWFKAEDWTQFEGNQIFGNYSTGGYGLFNKQNIPTTLFTLYDTTNKYVYNLNSQLKLIGERGTEFNNNIYNLPVYIMRTSDYNYWLINANNLNASKYDLNNNKLLDIDLSLKNIKQINQVEIDGDENIYILDNSTKLIAKFDSYTGIFLNNMFEGVQNFNLKNNFNRIEIAKNYKGPQSLVIHRQGIYSVLGIYAEHSVLDNYNNIWSSIGVNLYKNNNLFGSIGKIEHITCDTKDNIWILHDSVFVTKINSSTNDILLTKQISDRKTKSQKLYINFITTKKDNKEKECLVALCSEEAAINIIDIDTGNIIDSIYLLALPSIFLSKRNFNRSNINFTAHGDFSGYQLQRKFNIAQELVWRVNVTESSINTQNAEDYKTFELPFVTENFEKGWHYFNFVFNHADGYVAAYVDGIQVSKINFNPFQYLINPTNRPYCIGAITTEQGILNDTIGINDINKTIGSFAKLHVYSNAFNKHDINCLFKSTFKDMYKDMVWNINIGNRNYIEQIEGFFKHKMPGNKSNFFNLKIKNFPATEEQRLIIEQVIRDAIKKIAPADTTLNQIKWEY